MQLTPADFQVIMAALKHAMMTFEDASRQSRMMLKTDLAVHQEAMVQACSIVHQKIERQAPPGLLDGPQLIQFGNS